MKLLIEFFIILQLLLGAPLNVMVTPSQGLPSWYAPGESQEANKALDALSIAAEHEGVWFWITSTYRDYSYQEEVAKRESDRQPDRYRSYSAQPGHSEHQLGTAFDVAWAGLPVESLDPRNLKLHQWLEENAHIYGFIVSYPYKEISTWPFHNRWLPVVTDYIYEPWHIRYVGIGLASRMWEEGYLNPQSPVLPQDYYIPWP